MPWSATQRGLVVDEDRDPTVHVTRQMEDGLRNLECGNPDFKPLLAESLKSEDALVTRYLSTMAPFSPRIASEVWSFTSAACAEMTLSSFNSPSTFAHLADDHVELTALASDAVTCRLPVPITDGGHGVPDRTASGHRGAAVLDRVGRIHEKAMLR